MSATSRRGLVCLMTVVRAEHACMCLARKRVLMGQRGIQWAFCKTNEVRADMGVPSGGSDGAMSEQSLNDS